MPIRLIEDMVCGQRHQKTIVALRHKSAKDSSGEKRQFEQLVFAFSEQPG